MDELNERIEVKVKELNLTKEQAKIYDELVTNLYIFKQYKSAKEWYEKLHVLEKWEELNSFHKIYYSDLFFGGKYKNIGIVYRANKNSLKALEKRGIIEVIELSKYGYIDKVKLKDDIL